MAAVSKKWIIWEVKHRKPSKDCFDIANVTYILQKAESQTTIFGHKVLLGENPELQT